MRKPLNFAILEHFIKTDEACADDIVQALKNDYSGLKFFTKKYITEALFTAEKNGLITETKVDADNVGNLKIYYTSDDDAKETIKKYI